MPSNNLPARRSSLFGGALASREDRAAGKTFGTLQTGAFLERAEDELRRDLALGRMSDKGMETRHAMAEGDEIVADLASRIENNPLGANALGGLAERGMRALGRELDRERW